MTDAFVVFYATQICSARFVLFKVVCWKLSKSKIIGFVPFYSTSAFLHVVLSTRSSYFACKVF